MPKRRRGRPPKELGGFSQTREELLRAGVAILTEKGFSATGIDEVLRAVSVPKGSFYHYFASKEAFGAALIERYAGFFAAKLDRFLADESLAPLQRIAAFVSDAEEGMARYGYRRGCLVGNLGQEMSALPESYRHLLSAVFADWQARLSTCLEAAREAGQIRDDADCAALAELFWIGWEGAVLRAKLEQEPGPLRVFADFYLAAVKR